MKTFATVLLLLTLITLTWLSLGWIALLVIPFIALYALMTFAPLLEEWPQEQYETARPRQALKERSAPC